jgi:Outer membrane protein beta-barrel domain
LKNRFLLLSLITLLAFGGLAAAQQADIAFGVGTAMASYSPNSSLNYPLQPLKGGAFPSFSGDVIFHNRLGFGAEVSWREKQGVYGGYQAYRPIFYDFNAVYQPNFGKKLGAEVQAGFGGLSTRFYNNYYTCGFVSCTNYNSSNHASFHFGGGIRYYFWHSFFVRPEANIYYVPNNNEFSNNTITRVGASIGYSLKPE